MNHTHYTTDAVLPVYKQRGETLALLCTRIRIEYNIENSIPVTYAGRLDPMAEGLVIILTGEKCKEKDIFTELDKTYEFEVLIGVATDTYDVLGAIEHTDLSRHVAQSQVESGCVLLAQKKDFTYPPYSSKPINGLPLFTHARNGTLPESMPFLKGSITALTVHSTDEKSLTSVVEEIEHDITRVVGDFRQEMILEKWKNIQHENNTSSVQLFQCSVICTSGMYVRSIARGIGVMLGIPALAYKIKRTRIGTYTLDNEV